MPQPPLIIRLNWLIQTPLRQPPLRPRNATLHASSHNRDDFDAERLEFDAQGVGVGVERGFGGIVDGAEDVGDDGGKGSDLDDCAAGVDEEWGEGLDDVHYGEQVCLEGGTGFVEGDVEGGHRVVCTWAHEVRDGMWNQPVAHTRTVTHSSQRY